MAPRIRMETISEAWNWFRSEMGLWVAATLIVLVITFACAIPFYAMAFITMMKPNPTFNDIMAFYAWSIPAAIMLYVGHAIGIAGMYNMAVKQIQGEEISLREFFNFRGMFIQHLIAGIVISLAILIGSIACYLPAFILGGLLMFTQPIIVHQRIGAFAALSQSWNLLKDQIWMATAFFFIVSLIASLGSLACLVGMLFTYPLYPLAVSLVYRDHLSALYGQKAPTS